MNIEEDPDYQKYIKVYEQKRKWEEKASFDESLTPEQKAHAERQCLKYTKEACDLLSKINAKLEEENGPMPPLDRQDFIRIRNQLAENGQELTLEEVQELLTEPDEEW